LLSTKLSNASSRAPARIARASTSGLLGALLLLSIGGALAAWFAWDVRGDEGHGAVGPEALSHERNLDREPALSTTGSGPAGAEQPQEHEGRGGIAAQPTQGPFATPADRTTAQLGTIRGNVQTAPGRELPGTWRLIVEPSPFYQGHGAGVRRAVDLPGTDNSFAVRDLPLAGYAVHAEAAGFNSLPVHLLLTAGSEEQLVNLVLSPSGFLDGFARDVEGQPVEGLLVTLEARSDRSRRGVTTQADGTFLFHDVLDGDYTILFGDPQAPLVASRELSFKAPSLRFPDVEVPLTGELVLLTFDRKGAPLPEVDVRGFGSEGGQVTTMTDDEGRCTVQLLRPGRYRLFASTEDGRESRMHVAVRAGETTEVELRLHPR